MRDPNRRCDVCNTPGCRPIDHLDKTLSDQDARRFAQVILDEGGLSSARAKMLARYILSLPEPPSPPGTGSPEFDAPWWPPRVGDKLRELHGPDHAPEDDLAHVIAVFRDREEDFCVTAVWWPGNQRWHRQVRTIVEAHVGLIRPDGTPRKNR